MNSLSTFYRIIVCALVVILLLDGCHWTFLWKSSLVWVMTCCRPLTRHCLNQGWPRSMSPYGISRTHWVYLLLTVVLPTVSVRKSSAMKYTIPVCVLWYIGAERKWPFVDDILNFSPWTKFVVFWFEFHWNLFPEVQLPIGQYWFR